MHSRFLISDFRFGGAAVLATLSLVSPLCAQEKTNLLANGGFEKSIETNMGPDNSQYKPLFERKVTLPTGERALMPDSVYLNPADGWAGAGNRFEYVEGKPGDAVHSGARAVRIVSPNGASAIALTGQISVVEGLGLEDGAVQVGTPVPFSFFAKGTGTLTVNCYMYGAKGVGIYDYAKCRTVEPAEFVISEGAGWRKQEGTMRINCPEVQHILLVIAVRGEVTVDDVILRVP